MTDTTTAAPPATAATTTPRRTTPRPTVSLRPVAVGAVNAATIVGATAVAAGGGLVLASLVGGAALAATAAGARKTGHGKANKAATGSPFRNPTKAGGSPAGSGGRTGGGLPRAGRSGAASPGGRAPGSKPSPTPRTAAGSPSRGSLLPKLTGGRSGNPGGSRENGTAGSSRRGTTTPGGHRRAGSKPGSGSRSPLTADKVAAARRKLTNRRQPGPRLSDAINKATQPTAAGKKPTARQAFASARRAVTGTNPKNRGPLRRAAAGLIAGGIAAGKTAYASRQRRRKRDAARQAKNNRIAARRGPQVDTTVRRAAGTSNPATAQKKPAPAPVPRRTPTGSTPAPVTEGLITMTNPLLAISDDFLAAAGRNLPEGMLQVTTEAHLLPHVMANLVAAMKMRYDQAQEHPLHPDIKEMYGLVHKAQTAVQLAAEEIGRAIEKVHELELNRLRNQRVGEEMWDVARNRGAA